MELARWEREANKPINWGERTYWNLKRREKETLTDDNETVGSHASSLTISKSIHSNYNVRKALEDHPVVTGPLDASDVLGLLSEDEQCLFFSQFPKCECLVLLRWTTMSVNVLRCISIACGETLLELDLSGSMVAAPHLEVVLVRTVNLRTLRLNNCPNVDVKAAMAFVPLVSRCLQELYLHRCISVSNEVVQWIGGKGSLAGLALSQLRTLDLSDCSNIDDRGLIALSHGCRRLRFLNLENLSSITDKSMVEICTNCKKIQLLNLNGCFGITNKTVSAIGRNLSQLVTLNLSRCAQITDKSMKTVALGCKGLQAVNLSGLVKISEESMFCLVDSCKGMLTMNLTGCERVTTNGLDNLVMGMKFVEKATTFFGFKPIDAYLEKILDMKLKMVLTRDSMNFEEEVRRKTAEEKVRAEKYHLLITRSATLIQQYLFRYKKRMHFYRLWQFRLAKIAVGNIQRVYRGYRGRLKAFQEREEYLAFLAKSPQAQLLQCHVRGYLCRLKNEAVSQRIRELYIIRRREVESALAVRIQAHARAFLAKLYVISYRELQIRYRQNVYDAILIIQMLVRRFLSKKELRRRHTKKKNLEEARRTAGLKIKKFSVEGMQRYKARLSGEELKRFFRHKWTASIVAQRVYRGFKARQALQKLRIEQATRHYAAREIQRIFRGSRVLHYKDLRLNVIAAFVLDRHYVERRERVEAARIRYRQYILMNQQDSASEPDTEEDEQVPWTQQFDVKKKLPYWQNFATNEITYDEPHIPLAHEKGMIGKRVKVYWVVQSAWYEGTVTRYHIRKGRHRIEYDDGDHEWMNLEAEGERVQVLAEDNTWILYLMYQSEAKQDEVRKQEEKAKRDEYKAKAFRDATQWKSFIDDYNNQIMFLSAITGEIRSGQPNALEWIVQDDGYGFPVFYNTVTHQMLYEDPRFKNDIDEDTLQQRKYVMQEMRYLVYLCKTLWEEYEHIFHIQDKHQMHKMMMKIRNSPQVQQLSAFIIRAKALYEPTSIVDKPLDKALADEFNYASWLVMRLSEVVEKTELQLIERKDKKRELINKLTEKNDEVVYCRFCKRETQKHLSYCPTCGKQQIFY